MIHSVLCIANLVPLNSTFYSALIGVECRFTTFDLEKDDLTELARGESIEYDIVYSLPDEGHIFGIEWKIRESRKDFFIDFSEYTPTRAPYSRAPNISMFMERDDPHNEDSDNKANETSENEKQWIHIFKNNTNSLLRSQVLSVYYARILKKQL